MTPKQRHGLLAVCLIGTFCLVWFVSDDTAATDPVPRSAKRVRHDRQYRDASSESSLGIAGSYDHLVRIERSALSADIPDLFRERTWYVPPPAPPPPPPPPKPKPTAPPLPFTFIGQYVEGDARSFILAHGDRLLTVAAGDVIDNIYRVAGLDESQLVLVYLPLDTKQMLNVGVFR